MPCIAIEEGRGHLRKFYNYQNCVSSQLTDIGRWESIRITFNLSIR
jgi:hypothetical protein